MTNQENKKIVTTEVKNIDEVLKDRLDFGFDSIYFRYAEVCDELAMYKVLYEHLTPSEAKMRMNSQKMHFYNTLEQLIHAHPNQEVRR